MTRIEQTWAADVLNAFTLESESGLCPRAGEVDYLSAYRRMCLRSTALAGFGLRLAVWMVALAPLWLLGRLSTFSKMACRERTELLTRLLVHNSFVVRELTMLLKLTAAMALLGTLSVRARSGYDNVRAATQIESGLRVHLPIAQRLPVEPGHPHSEAPAEPRAAS
jgi:hypothetical protein